MSKSKVAPDRRREIIALAEAVAETHCLGQFIEPIRIMVNKEITHSANYYGEGFDGMLEHRTVSLLENVGQVFGRGPIRRIALAHVAEAPRELGETLTIGALAQPMNRQVFRFGELRSGENADLRFGEKHGARREVNEASPCARKLESGARVVHDTRRVARRRVAGRVPQMLAPSAR